MTVGTALADFGFLLGRTRTVKPCDVGLLLCFGFDFVLSRLGLHLGALESDAAHHGLRDFVIAGFACSGHKMNLV